MLWQETLCLSTNTKAMALSKKNTHLVKKNNTHMSRPVVFTSLTHSLSPLFFRIDSPCPPPASPTAMATMASPRCRVFPRSHGLTPPHALPRPRPIDAILRPRVSQRRPDPSTRKEEWRRRRPQPLCSG